LSDITKSKKQPKRFNKIYVEITNVCNLKCSFCPGTKREKCYMSSSEFEKVLQSIKPYTDYIYLHLMGEPLLHPELKRILEISAEYGMKTCITTNGTLLEKQYDILKDIKNIHKLSISLQAQEANESIRGRDEYLEKCFEFGKKLSSSAIISFRLWNEGGADSNNPHILEMLEDFFPKPWEYHPFGIKLCERVYLESGKKFDWPELPENEADILSAEHFCNGMRDQIGILSDGTVVPCCLDHEGDIALGNVFCDDMEKIITGSRAMRIYNGFSGRKAVEPLCKNCGYATLHYSEK